MTGTVKKSKIFICGQWSQETKKSSYIPLAQPAKLQSDYKKKKSVNYEEVQVRPVCDDKKCQSTKFHKNPVCDDKNCQSTKCVNM